MIVNKSLDLSDRNFTFPQITGLKNKFSEFCNSKPGNLWGAQRFGTKLGIAVLSL